MVRPDLDMASFVFFFFFCSLFLPSFFFPFSFFSFSLGGIAYMGNLSLYQEKSDIRKIGAPQSDTEENKYERMDNWLFQ